MRLISNEELSLIAGGDGESPDNPIIASPVEIVGSVPIEVVAPGNPPRPNGPIPTPYQPPITKIE
ncbi:hypothetical protein ACO0LL_30000 [Undibacterium sp. TC4M20W]|uniref:hypothetical protein n=1 Tax=unclassified Undibacterium TaxID=2630295 RepID=UPI003BF18326